eukprot:SAG22_NODE_264_length_13353_cov_34.575298_5_plen_78_part_00
MYLVIREFGPMMQSVRQNMRQTVQNPPRQDIRTHDAAKVPVRCSQFTKFSVPEDCFMNKDPHNNQTLASLHTKVGLQ